jgi:hypothetical protein
MKKNIRSLSVMLFAVAGVPFIASAQTVLFSDTFQTNSAAAWKVGGVGTRSGAILTNEYVAGFATNYTQIEYQPGSNIPPAPHSADGTNSRGLYLTCNHVVFSATASGTSQSANTINSNAAIAVVNAYPIGKNFTGNYSFRFDMFQTYNGGAGGGSGSTEMSMFGVNHSGTKTNWYSGHTSFVPANWPSDGQWFWVDGEGGTGSTDPAAGTVITTTHADMDAFVGNGTGASTALGGSGGFLYAQGVDYLSSTTPTAEVFPVPPGESWGAPGKTWAQVEVRSQGGFVTWLMNGFVIASHSTLNGFTNGDVMLGYSDPVRGTPPTNQWQYCFVVYDNVQVVDLGAETYTPTVTIVATDSSANKPGSNPSEYGTFTITRQDPSGSPVSPNTPLTVGFIISGSASNGLDYVSIPTSAVIPAGASSVDVTVRPTSRVGDPTSTVTIRLAPSYNYDLRTQTSYKDTVTITDLSGVPAVTPQASKPIAYEGYHGGQFNLSVATAFSSNVVINLSTTGTATNGTYYLTNEVDQTLISNKVTLIAGATNVLINLVPINNNIVEASNRTAILNVLAGPGYRIGGAGNATVLIRNDDLPAPGAILFSDALESGTSSNLWNVNLSTNTDLVQFDYDYSVDGIPSAPGSTNTTTKGVKLRANVAGGANRGLSLSPKGLNATGDYRLRFDFWVNYNGDSASGIGNGGGAESTMWFGGGVGTTGDHPVWDSTTSVRDSIWFDFDSDGSSTISEDYEAFRGSTSLLAGPNNVWFANSQSAASSYYAEFGSETAPAAQLNTYPFEQAGVSLPGTLSFRWHDMLIVKQGSNVTWSVDGLPIANVTTNGITLSTNVHITYYDPSTTANAYSDLSFALIDNVRVETLAVINPPTITFARTSTNVTLNWTGSGFTLQQATALSSSPPTNWTNVVGAVSGYTTGLTNGPRFFRLKQ